MMTTRSGTNQIHGSGNWDNRVNSLFARNALPSRTELAILFSTNMVERSGEPSSRTSSLFLVTFRVSGCGLVAIFSLPCQSSRSGGVISARVRKIRYSIL